MNDPIRNPNTFSHWIIRNNLIPENGVWGEFPNKETRVWDAKANTWITVSEANDRYQNK